MKFEGNRREGVTGEDRNVQQFYTIQLEASCSQFKRKFMGKAADKKLVANCRYSWRRIDF